MSVRPREPSAEEGGDIMELTPLGAGQEVGRSCFYMQFKGKTVMFDCGVHPAYTGYTSLPMIDDEFDVSAVDVLLVTHFHLDHCASLPYLLFKTSFQGRVFMTHSTKAIYAMMLSDYIRVSKVATKDMLFDDQDLKKSMEKIETVDFHQEMEVAGIRFKAYHAGHVLGAAMFLVEIGGTRVLYTGDYSREEDRHLRAAELPEVSPDVVVIESTYGVQSHMPRKDREKRFTEVIESTVLNGGRVLLPAFALGRAQELLLILEEYWRKRPELQHIPIYYASPLAKKCMKAYQTYINAMNSHIQDQYKENRNPFDFQYVQNLKGLQEFEDSGPCVIMASPGMLQSGMSRQLFDMWCGDPANACVIAGYCVEGTLAKHILTTPKEVTLMNGLTEQLNMSVHYISFSAHADFAQTAQFLSELKAPKVILVHGEATEMGRLRTALTHRFEVEGMECEVRTPKNCQTVQLTFRGDKTARVVGALAQAAPKEGAPVGGLLVGRDFGLQVLAPQDLQVYTQLSCGSVLQRQTVPFTARLQDLVARLQGLFESVQETEEDGLASCRVGEVLSVRQHSSQYVIMEWDSDPIADMVADSVLAIVLEMGDEAVGPHRQFWRAPGTGAAGPPEAGPPDLAADVCVALLRDMFGAVAVVQAPATDSPALGKENGASKEDSETGGGEAEQSGSEVDARNAGEREQGGERPIPEMSEVTVDGVTATVHHLSGKVECADEGLKERIQTALGRMQAAMFPLDIGC